MTLGEKITQNPECGGFYRTNNPVSLTNEFQGETEEYPMN